LWNKKASDWVKGRQNLFEELEQKLPKAGRLFWIHCSSAGEFEQGKPAIEALKKDYPSHKILVSFFSPSGFAVAKKYPFADYITYLPLDTRKNAERFLKLTNPEMVIFVKYEFWYHHLSAVAFHHIPLLLVSAVFRKEQVFFKWYGKFYRQMLFLFRQIFVQDKSSFELLQANGITHSAIGGDTRFDRVSTIANVSASIPLIEEFLRGKKSIVAGSTWEKDEELLKELSPKDIKIIIAPHEINETHLSQIRSLFPNAMYYSKLSFAQGEESNVLIIDNVGILSQLYQYATITYVGGGFTKDGIHNILEAAVWGKPVIFGPNYKKYREASELIEAGGGFSISTAKELKKLADKLLNDKQFLQASSANSKNYVLENTGATEKILQFIQEKRLLTN
jgi:3-deoxy-D-manno-octulosonic-acid transferase